MEKRHLIEEPDTEEKFADMPIMRDIEVCKQCDFFRMKEDGKCLCTNVYKQYGHPWCRESRFSLKPEWFVKANIFILDESRCANIAK